MRVPTAWGLGLEGHRWNSRVTRGLCEPVHQTTDSPRGRGPSTPASSAQGDTGLETDYASSLPSPCKSRSSLGGRAGVSWFDGWGGSEAMVVAWASRSSSDSSHSICVLKTRPKFREAAVATPSTVIYFRNSRSIDVTGLPVIPQGTINEKKSRSVATLRAKPWVVTEREIWTPMAAILASGLLRRA